MNFGTIIMPNAQVKLGQLCSRCCWAADKHQMAVPARLPYTDSTVRVASAEGARERRVSATARPPPPYAVKWRLSRETQGPVRPADGN